MLALCILWCAMSQYARKKGDLRLLLMMTMIAVHAFSEHHFMELMYNILLPLLFSEISDPKALYENQMTQISSFSTLNSEPTIISYWKIRKDRLIITATVAIVLCLIAPLQLSRIRTLLDITGYSGERIEKFHFLLQITIMILLISAPAILVINLLFYHRKYTQAKTILSIALSLLCLAGVYIVYVKESNFINNASSNYSSMIDKDYDAINLVLSSAEGKVCIEPVPEIYKRQFDDVSRTILFGDDLARLKCCTVVTDLGINRQRFTDIGFSFTPISECHAVYSNDLAVINALEDYGFSWTDYCNTVFEIDLKKMAEMNNMGLSSEGTLVLDGPEKRLKNGPGLDLYGGNYLLTCEMRLLNDQKTMKDVVCTIQITDYYEGHVLQEYKIMDSDFDQSEEMTFKSIFQTKSGSRNTEFCFIPSDNQQLEIKRLQYQKISNKAQTGWVFADGNWYYLDINSGEMMTGWVYVDKEWYYFNDSGEMMTGWVFADGNWYYLDISSGKIMTGWVYVDEKWYFLNSSGELMTGWVYVNEKWYFLNGSGEMMTGWVFVDGKWYYLDFENDGAMLENTKKKIDNRLYIFNNSGVCINPN